MQIKADFVQENGLYTGFSVSGHDLAAADTGISVLCAAVSSAVELTCNTLTEYFGVPQEAVQVHPAENAQNQIAVRLTEPDPVQSKLIQGLLLHLNLLSEESGGAVRVTVSGQ